MGWFRRATPIDPATLEQMQAELRALREALDGPQAAGTGRFAEPLEPPPPAGRVEDLVARLDAVERREPGVDPARLEALAEQLAALDARLTAVSTELANQLTELGHDIDALADGERGAGDAVLGELRDGQVRLANEQARYQIAFREDLARLAEQVRRPR